MKAGLYTFLSTQAAVVALAADRIYPGVIPEQVFDQASQKPCLTFELASTERQQTYCGTESLTKSGFRVTAFATTPEAAASLADAVLDSILDYRGSMGSTEVRTVVLDEQFDSVDIEPGLYRVDLLLSIWHAHP